MDAWDPRVLRDPKPSVPLLARLRNALYAYKFMIKPFCIVFIIYVIGISAIIRSNFYYLDDQGRTFEGYREWGDVFSRYLADFLANFLFADTYVTDISPLTQLIAAAEMALAAVLLAYLVLGRKTYDVWTYGALVPLALSPYFLECFSYKFDAPFMALSVLASIVPLLFFDYGPAIYISVVVAGTLVMCTTYQASSGILPMVCVFVAYKRWYRGERDQGWFVGQTALGYGIGILVFYFCLMKPLPQDSYITTDISVSSNLFLRFFQNYGRFFESFITQYKDLWLELMSVMVIAFFLTETITAQDHMFLTPLVSVAVIFWLFITAFGLYPLLSEPLVEARSMYGVGVVISLIALGICTTPRWYIAKGLCVILSWCFFVFAFTYGNMLQIQGQWNSFRTQQVINDLADLELLSSDQPKDLLVVGNVGLSPAFDAMDEEDRTILHSLIRQTFSGNWWWGIYGFKHYYQLEQLGHINVLVPAPNAANPEFDDLPLLKTTIYNRIYGDESHLKIELLEDQALS